MSFLGRNPPRSPLCPSLCKGRLGGILLIALFLFSFSAACTRHQNVNIDLIIENALTPAGLSVGQLPEIQRVVRFVVTVTGDDLDEPVVIHLDADATGTALEELPDGTARTFLVEALNSEGMVVRRKQIMNVTIDKDHAEPIVVSLNTVPLFTNLRSGNRVIVNRLQIQGVGEPGGRLEIDDSTETDTTVLFDVSLGDSLISPSVSLGTFAMVPGTLALGRHTLTIRDLDNGEQSQVDVRLVPPGSLPGLGMVSFGGINLSHVTSGGVSLHSFDVDLAHFPGVLQRSVQ